MLTDTDTGSIGAAALQRIASLVRPVRERLFHLLQLQRGDRCLDVGCGIGLDALAAADAVGASGLALGIDRDPLMIAEAERLASAGCGEYRPRFGLADASRLPFSGAAFDAVYTHRVLQHASHPISIFEDMCRVTRPGGRIAAIDSDRGTLAVDTPAAGLERRVVSELQQVIANARAGRQLPRLFGSGLVENLIVEAHAVVWRDYETFRHTTLSIPDVEGRLLQSGRLSSDDLTTFFDSLVEADRRGQFFATAILVLVVGVRV